MRSDSGTGSGRSSTLWTTENNAVFAPMQTASVSAAVTVKAESFQRRRRATRTSDSIRMVDVKRGPSVRFAAPSRKRVRLLDPERLGRIHAGRPPGGHEV